MMKITDDSGNIRVALSALVLFVNHGMRDYLITALPAISSSPSSEGSQLVAEMNVFIHAFRTLQRGSDISYKESSEWLPVLNSEAGWTSGSVGGVLCILHFGWLISIMAAPFAIRRLKTKLLLSASLAAAGVISLFSELSAGNLSGLLIIRALQGVSQGWCYPLVFVLLESVNPSSPALPFFFIFLGPWLGSGLGALLGMAGNSFAGSYVFGSLSIVVAAMTLLVPLPTFDSAKEPKGAWKECLSSSAVWICVFLQMGVTWMIHLFLVGTSFTLYFRQNHSELLWTVFVVLVIGGFACRLIAMIAMSLLRNHFFTPLNRRRVIISLGFAIIVISLFVIGAAGIERKFVLTGITLLAFCGGVSLALVGIRANLHDLGPLFPTPFLILGSMGATVGAGGASLLFPIMAQIGNIEPQMSDDQIDNSSWQIAWLVPTVILILGCLAHLFLVSVIPLAHQTLVVNVNGIGTSEFKESVPNKVDIDARSFKSTKSALSFHSAVSKHRTRTVSFKTVDDNFEGELKSVRGSDDDEDCQSIPQDDQKDDLKSIRSGAPSFKSVVENSNRLSVDRGKLETLRPQDLDRTSAWLSTYHNGIKIVRETSAEKETVNKNILLALQW